jgi:uncharacterized membrane protein YccC
MATISVQAHLSPTQILDAVKQLDGEELAHVTREAMRLAAQHKAAAQFQREAELLDVIFAQKSAAFRRRFDRLNAKRRRAQLSPDEHAELLRLIDEVQAADVRYVEALSELAKLRGISLPELMSQLGLQRMP